MNHQSDSPLSGSRLNCIIEDGSSIKTHHHRPSKRLPYATSRRLRPSREPHRDIIEDPGHSIKPPSNHLRVIPWLPKFLIRAGVPHSRKSGVWNSGPPAPGSSCRHETNTSCFYGRLILNNHVKIDKSMADSFVSLKRGPRSGHIKVGHQSCPPGSPGYLRDELSARRLDPRVQLPAQGHSVIIDHFIDSLGFSSDKELGCMLVAKFGSLESSCLFGLVEMHE
jgi:hypothetical protein